MTPSSLKHLWWIVGVMLAALSANAPAEEAKTWTTSSFLDFVDGTVSDGGVNTYVASDGSVRLINLRDLNNDGNFDIPVACAQDHDESVELFIYAANELGYDAKRRTELPTQGAIAATAADLNGDGHAELVVANRFDGESTDLDAYIYWGAADGFAAARRTTLPAKAARAVAVGDLNGDGHPEIVIANQGVDYHMVVDEFQKSFVYWGSPQGYSPNRRLTLATINCTDVEIADLNGDQHPDIAFVNEGNRASESGVAIYLGDGDGGFSERRRVELPGIYSSALKVTDLNGDGRLDIILANPFQLRGKADPPTGNHVGTYFVNSYVYWGTADGYTPCRRTELPTVGAQGTAAGDLNADGLPDIVFANSADDASFIYWNSPQGFASHRRSQIRTPYAHDVAVKDLNADGHPDLVFANYASAGFFDTQSYVYWGDPQGIAPAPPTKLPTSGASGIVAADLHGSGLQDLIFVNKIEGVSYGGGTTTSFADLGPTTSWIYWGDAEGQFRADRRQGLPTTRGADGYVTADFNCDGFTDLLFAQYGDSTLIYWGAPQGFSEKNTYAVPDGKSGMGRTADLDRDGHLDLLLNSAVIYGRADRFSTNHRFVFEPSTHYPSLADLNRDGWLDVVSALHDRVIIYWNAPHGFDNERTSTLAIPGKAASTAELADFNRDGFLDLVVVNQVDAGKPLGPGEKAVHHGNPNADSYIYWGGGEGFSADRRLALPTIGANDTVAADLNSDGFVDVFFPSYLGGVHRHFPGFIYWNGPEGFDAQRKSSVPGYSGCGTFAADCNLDGHQDLIVANHTRIGNHRSDIWIHWGGPQGYSPRERTSLPATGPHFFSLVDVGNIYDRSSRYDYVSPPFDAGEGVKLRSMAWEAQTPFRTRVEFQIRTAATARELESTRWQGPDGPRTFYRSSGDRLSPAADRHRWVQYKASLISPNSANTPVLQSVSIEFE